MIDRPDSSAEHQRSPEDETPAPATSFAAGLLDGLVRRGVRDVVVSPGSRSQALALAAAAFERAGAIALHVRIDERSAGFFALGLAVETRRPVAVVVTSGTAVANLHPAVLEAHHSLIPLVLLTADRPEELRGIRSNQTTVQPGIFGGATRFAVDVAAPVGLRSEARAADELADNAVSYAIGRGEAGAGPVHLNLAFREPLSSGFVHVPHQLVDALSDDGSLTLPPSAAATAVYRPSILLDRDKRTVVIAGHAAGPAAEALAHAGGWPLVAEVSSDARYGRNLVVAYRRLLAEAELGGRIERAVVFGHPTLSREIPALLSRDGIDVTIVAPTGGEVYNPGRRSVRVVSSVAVVEGPIDRAWLGSWVTASRAIAEAESRDTAPDLEAAHSHDRAERLAYVKAEFSAVRQPIDRRLLVEAVWRATWPHDRLVFGASRLIREADEAVGGKKIRVHANRGLAGIDGTISTGLGIATASQRAGTPGVTRVLVGDLTALHDVGGMLLAAGETPPRLQLVVGDDGGGTIFDGLEVAATAREDDVERVLYTPRDVDLEAIARGFGWQHVRVSTRAELDQALTAQTASPTLIEVPLER
ncbi:2-succinyl-5-enolpyruvyl-6-hydroxy-3-cyclohexene-1-carboxylate synthase [Labedella gwakjiensis]|uniref:2-succinyl-5-enolpyruvyl-6-hydroxy-3-cyclohexene-1-carboxylate synthase n=1 Tax=Labedella gwakjiensis TaxID=390269 RepID=A0A2P8GSV8_9MICO|nr:2-succinyl-5-enolpyruvyl-6-hydroxy-3-cyclohexene-1-carboxylic-acid synthase [Labedella gwakjiensis]PSL37056.1 2-succinyl-5-enolpyruvyl-6-hydroxy-3-cyclohexene-1-carboxylate synthase [Labedella gwakjiensis]RUQ82035.1 2-succinyl-5-enolpyruvyl-6-hydroxy-3-cyclohexene-1-carboxylic-acid synthase [Labedella gwakjiensis]